MVLAASETYARDVTFAKDSEAEDFAEMAAFWYIVGHIGEPPQAPIEHALSPEDPTATPGPHQYADYFGEACVLGTAVAGHWQYAPWLFDSGEGLWSQTNEVSYATSRRLCRSLSRGVHRRLQLEQDVVAKYSRFKQVEKIHLLESSEVVRVFVWLNQMKYDDDLMDRLLDQEWAIGRRFSDQLVEFFYYPLPRDGTAPTVPDSARLVLG